MYLKQKAFRSPKYIRYVKSLVCVYCGAPADDPHHGIGLKLGGMGLTAPDWAAIPVCRGCHSKLHITPELWPGQWEHIARTIAGAIDLGILTISKGG